MANHIRTTLSPEQARLKGTSIENFGMMTEVAGRIYAVVTGMDDGRRHFLVCRSRSQYTKELDRLYAGKVERKSPPEFFLALGCESFTHF